jgi:3-phosphoshikimate 1-carboxyvinyltransferase
MKKKVEPSAIRGKLQAPPSKSYAQRAIAIAALAAGPSEILFPGSSDDVKAAVNVVRQMGAKVSVSGDSLRISGGISVPNETLDCGEAGLSIRMFSSIASVFHDPVTLSGRGSLLKRPMKVVEESLRTIGVECSSNNGYLPLTVCGPIRGGVAEIDGSFSSQVLTGMLIASPYAQNDVTLLVNNLKSRPYIDITLAVMGSFGVKAENRGYSEFFVRSGQKYRPASYMVEGDWSGAAFLLVAGAVGGEVTVENINMASPQADRTIVDALKMSGALVSVRGHKICVTRAPLKAFEFDATDCPDLFPPLVCLASYCRGETRIRGAGRLIHKESNRAETLREEFGKLGVYVNVEQDIMVVKGSGCKGGIVSSHGDHRIAMACAVAAIASEEGAEIEGSEAVTKSYPDFFEDLEKLKI